MGILGNWLISILAGLLYIIRFSTKATILHKSAKLLQQKPVTGWLFFLIGKGMLWGNVVGIAICLIQSHFRIIKLDPSIYYLDAVPIDLSIVSLILLNIGTLCASMLMMLGPSYLITKIDPAKSIRFE